MDVGQNLVPLVNIKIAGKWMFIPLKMVLIGIDPYPYEKTLELDGPSAICWPFRSSPVVAELGLKAGQLRDWGTKPGLRPLD